MTTQKELGEHIDLSDRHIRRLVKDGVLPPAKANKGYDIDACRLAYLRYLRGLAMGQVEAHHDGEEGYDSEAERARLLHHQANLAAIKEEEERGNLARVDDVARIWGEETTTFRNRMLQLPGRVVSLIIGETDERKVKETLQDEIEQALEVLSTGDDLDE